MEGSTQILGLGSVEKKEEKSTHNNNKKKESRRQFFSLLGYRFGR